MAATMVANRDQYLDAKGFNCRLLRLQAKRARVAMKSGETRYVTATDPGSLRDFSAYADEAGHVLRRTEKRDEVFHSLVEKGP